MTKEITIGPIDISGSITVLFENKGLLDKIRRDLNVGTDPCDEMATTEQVFEYLIGKHIIGQWHSGLMYDNAAAIWGIDRETAKRRIYEYCYGG